MKRLFRWTVAAALAAILSASLAGGGVAQDSADQKAKAEEATKVADVKKAIEAKKAAIARDAKKVAGAKKAELVKKQRSAQDAKKIAQAKQADQAKKQRSAQDAKLQALRKSVDDLMAKRKALLQTAEKDAPQVEKITAQIEKITQRAQELRHAAKPAAPKIVKKNVADAKVDSKVQIARLKIDAAKQRSGQDERVQGLGLKTKREKPQDKQVPYVKRMEQRGLQGDRVGVDFPKENIRQRVRVANDRERDAQARQSSRSAENIDRPGPMEVTRRLQVLEDRLSSIERKLDQLLQQVSRRGVGPDGSPINRRPGIGGGGPGVPPPQTRNEGASRRSPRPDGPPSDRGPRAGFGNPDGGPPRMRNENDGQDRARRPRDAEQRPDRTRSPEDRSRGELDQIPPPRFPGEPDGPPRGARNVPPPPDSSDAPPRRERTPPPDDQQGSRGR